MFNCLGSAASARNASSKKMPAREYARCSHARLPAPPPVRRSCRASPERRQAPALRSATSSRTPAVRVRGPKTTATRSDARYRISHAIQAKQYTHPLEGEVWSAGAVWGACGCRGCAGAGACAFAAPPTEGGLAACDEKALTSVRRTATVVAAVGRRRVFPVVFREIDASGRKDGRTHPMCKAIQK
jgi:hypothetical protein